MRSRGAWLAGAAAAALAGSAAAEIGPRAASDFHRRALLAGAVSQGGAYAVALSAEAVAALQQGGELRVFDAAGREIPSLVHAAASRAEVVERPVSVFNRAFREDGTQTLSVEVEGRLPQPVNEFVFEVADADYNARVRVEASQDGAAWDLLRDGLHLIRHTVEQEEIDYRHDVLRVPTARFRFYRFTLRPVVPPAREQGPARPPLEIRGVAVREVVRRGEVLALRVTPERYRDEEDRDPRHHHWRLDLGHAGLGVDHVAFDVPARDFARSASLWEWSPERRRRTRMLASTVAFHYGDDVHTEFSGFTSDARVLALRIDQGDDEPVTVASAVASRPRQQVRFLAPAGVEPPLALYFAPDAAREPRYDLERRLRENEIGAFAELEHAPLEDNPAYAAPAAPRSERIPHLLYLLVVPLVAGLGFYVARTIQRGVPPEAPPDA